MERLDLYKCEICGNIVEIISSGAGELVCCGQPMKKLIPQVNENAMMEKHVPVVVKLDNDTTEIRVGEVLHPMSEEHHIVFVEAISHDRNHAQIKFLNISDEPKMKLCNEFDEIIAREYCNIHGLWQNK
jgi:superoxide reductase